MNNINLNSASEEVSIDNQLTQVTSSYEKTKTKENTQSVFFKNLEFIEEKYGKELTEIDLLKEEFSHGSILDRDINFPLFDSKSNWLSDLKGYLHIIGDSIIQEMDLLKGMRFDQASDLLSKFLMLLSKKEGISRIIDKTIMEKMAAKYEKLSAFSINLHKSTNYREVSQRMEAIHCAAQSMADQLQKLKEGEDLLFPGGWAGSTLNSGHAVLIRFLKAGDVFHISIYNTGSGIEILHDELLQENKFLASQVIRYKVPIKVFFLSEGSNAPQFWRLHKLIECLVEPSFDSNLKVDSKTFYRIFADLEEYRDNNINKLPRYSTLQRSGTCALRVQLPLLYDLLEEEDLSSQYKWLLFQLEFLSTISFFQKYEKILKTNSVEGSQVRNALGYGAHILSNRSAKLFSLENKEMLCEKEIQTCFSTVKDLINRLTNSEEEIIKTLRQEIRSHNIEKKPTEKSHKNLLDSLQIGGTKEQKSIDKLMKSRLWIKPLQPSNEPQKFLNSLSRLVSACGSYDLNINSDAFICILDFVDQLTIPSKENDFWQKIPEDDLNSCLQYFSIISNQMAEVILNPFPRTVKEINFFLSLYAIIDTLARRVNEIDCKKTGAPLLPSVLLDTTELENDWRFIFYDKNDYEKRMLVYEYFRNQKGGKIFKFNGEVNAKEFNKNSEAIYYQNLIDSNPTLKKKLLEVDLFPAKEFEQRNRFEIDEMKSSYSKHQKAILHLFTTTTLTPEKILEETGLQYLTFLKTAALLAKFASFFVYNIGFEKFKFRFKQGIAICMCDSITKAVILQHTLNYFLLRSEDSTKEDKVAHNKLEAIKDSKFQHIPFSDKTKQEFIDYSGNKNRFSDEIKDEGYALISQHPKERHTAEPILTFYSLLYEFRNEGDFTTLDKQARFDRQFFKHYTFYNKKDLIKESYPLLDELKKNGVLIDLIADFVQEGINKYYSGSNLHPDVYSALFFIRFSARIKNLIPKEGHGKFLNELGLLQEWFNNPDLNTSEKACISAHLLFLASLGINSEFFDEKDEQKWSKLVLRCWIYMHANLIDEKWRDASLQENIKIWFYKNCSRFYKVLNEKDFCHELFSEVLIDLDLKGSLKEEKSEKIIMEISPPVYRYVFGNRYWEIDIQTAQVGSESGPIHVKTILEDRFLTNDYVRVFGEKPVAVTKIGEAFHFIHPKYGEVRLEGNEIQRYSDQNQTWMKYVPPNFFEGKEFKKCLVNDCTHWIPVQKAKNIPQMEIWDLQKKEKIGFINEDDVLQFGDGCTLVEMDSPNLMQKLQRFESMDYIVIRKDRDIGVTVNFPRYISMNGNPIAFEIDSKNEKVLYTSDKSLNLSNAEWHGFPGFNTFLPLANSKGKIEKIIIPLRPLKHFLGLDFSSFCSMDLQGKEEFGFREDYESAQYTCLEFDVKESEIAAQNTEGWLFLAYIRLAQRQYSKSLEHLNQISQMDTISATSLRILWWIIRTQNTYGIVKDLELTKEVFCTGILSDLGPNATAIRLHAAALLLRAEEHPKFLHCEPVKDNKNVSKVKFEIEGFLLENYPKYLDLLSHIDSSIQISEKIERFFFNRCPKIRDNAILENRWHYLKKGVYLPFKESRIKKNLSLKYLKPDIPLNPDLPRTFYREDDKLAQSLYDYQNKYPTPLSKLNLPLILHQPNELVAVFWDLYEFARTGSKNDKNAVRFIVNNINYWHSNEKLYSYCEWLFIALEDKEAPIPPKIERKYDKKDQTYKVDFHGLDTWLMYIQIEVSSAPFEFKKEIRISKIQEIAHRLILPEDKNLLTNEVLEEPISWQPKKRDLGIEDITVTDYFTEISNQKKEIRNLNTVPKLTEKEEIFRSPIEESFKEAQKNYECAVRIQEKQKTYVLKNDTTKLKKRLLEKKNKVEPFLSSLEAKIIKLANKTSLNKNKIQRDLLLLTSGVIKDITLNELLFTFLKRQRKPFHQLNSSLTVEEIDLLYQWIGEFLEAATDKQQVDRALLLISNWEESNENETKKRLSHELAKVLNSKRTYLLDEGLEELLFEYKTGFRIYPEQQKMIDTLSERGDSGSYFNVVYQLIMGKGKTKVVIPICFRKSKKGQLLFFVAPAHLFEMIKGDLRDSQERNCGQKINAIDLERRSFTLKNLQWIEKQLKKAMKDEEIIVMKSEQLQTLALQHLFLSIECVKHHLVGTQANQELEVLGRILELIGKADAIGDEAHYLYNILKAINFPMGDRSFLAPNYISLIKEIYQILSKEELQKIVKQSENQGHRLSLDDYHRWIKPALAEALKNHPLIDLPEEYQASFMRYVKNEINSDFQKFVDQKTLKFEGTLEEKKDVEFLRLLKEWDDSDNPKNYDKAQIIALTFYQLKDVLPSTLRKNWNVDYIREKGEESKIVVPCHGVGEPSDSSLFGNIYETACFQFQTTIFKGVTAQQLIEYEETLLIAACNYAKLEKKKPEDTFEAIDFKKVTSVELGFLKDNLDQALKYVNSDLQRKLDVEECTIRGIEFHSKQLNAPAMMPPSLTHTNRVVTGTPFNHNTYSELFKQENKFFTEGTEGQIINLLLDQELKNKNIIHSVSSKNPETLFKEVIKNQADKTRTEKIGGLIDVGAFFKESSNLAVAKDALKCFPHIDAVVFFWYKEDDLDKVPNKPVILIRGQDKPKFLENTSLLEIQKHKISIKKIFFYYDDSRKEGVDFPQAGDRCNLLAVDPNITVKVGFEQGASRLRQLEGDQKVEYIIFADSENTFIDEGKTLMGLYQTCGKNQAIKLSLLVFDSYRQKMKYAIMDHASKKLRTTKEIDKRAKIIEEYEKFLIDEVGGSPYKQFGSLQDWLDPIEALENYAKQLKTRFSSDKNLVESIDNLLNDAKINKKLLPKIVNNPSKTQDLGMEIVRQKELQEQKELQIEQMEEKETEINVQRELDLYRDYSWIALKKEIPLDETFFNYALKASWINHANALKNFEITCLQDLFEDKYLKENNIDYTADYSDIFDKNIFLTSNFIKTVNGAALSVFHKLQKPAQQILIIQREKEFEAWFLSYKEAAAVHTFLYNESQNQESLCKNMWLVTPDGKPLVDTPLPFPIKNKAVIGILIQANFFNGTVSLLNKDSFGSWDWFKKDFKNKLHYLERKIFYSPLQKALFKRSPIKQIYSQEDQKLLLSPLRKLYVEKQREVINAFSPNEFKNLTEDAISFVSQNNIKHLGPGQIPFLEFSQVGWVTKEQVSFLRSYHLYYLKTKEQVSAVAKENYIHLSPESLGMLSEEKLQDISNTKIINKILQKDLHKLTGKQRKQLNEVQQGELKSLILELQNQIKMVNISGLSKRSDIYLLEKEQVNQISESQVQFLSNEQVRWLEQVHLINQVEEEKLKYLSPEVISLLKDEKLGKLVDSEQIKKVPVEKTHLLKTEVLSENQIDYFIDKILTKNNVSLLTKNHDRIIKKITSTNLIQALNKEQVNWVAIEQLPLLDLNTQVGWLRDESLIRAIDENRIDYINPESVLCMSDQQISKIEIPLQIEKVPSLKVPLIALKSVKHISKFQLPYLNNNQVTYLKSKENKLLIEKMDSLDKGDVAILRAIMNSDLIRLLKKDCIDQLQISQLQWLSSEQYLQLTNEELIQALPVEKLGPNQVNKMSPQQIAKLTDREMIQQVPNQFVYYVRVYNEPEKTKKLIGYLNDEQLQHINEYQLVTLDASNHSIIKRIKNEPLIKQLDNIQVNYIEISQINVLNHQQLSWLTEKSLIEAVATEKVEHIDSRYVIFLKNEQLPCLIETQIEKNSSWIKTRLESLPLKDGELKAFIRSIKCSKMVGLLPKQFINLIDPKHLIGLLDHQWEWLTDEDLIQLAPVEKLKPMHASKISPTQIKALKDCAIIGKLSKEQIEFINPSQFSLLSEEQLSWMNAEKRVEAPRNEEGENENNDNDKVENVEIVKDDAYSDNSERQVKEEILEENVKEEIEAKTEEKIEEEIKTPDSKENQSVRVSHMVENVLKPQEMTSTKTYWSSTVARRMNEILNRQSDYWQVSSKEGWKKILYLGNVVTIAKCAHLFAAIINIITVVVEVFIALSLFSVCLWKIPAAALLVLSPGVFNGKLNHYVWDNWNWSPLGHVMNATAYAIAALIDMGSLLTTPALLGSDINNQFKKKFSIIESNNKADKAA